MKYKQYPRRYSFVYSAFILAILSFLCAIAWQVEAQEDKASTIMIPVGITPTSTPTCSENVSYCPLPDRPDICWDGSSASGHHACPPEPVECGQPGQPACSPISLASSTRSKDKSAHERPGPSIPVPEPILISLSNHIGQSDVYWVDDMGGWHLVEGWRSTNPNKVIWYVRSQDVGTGPFRWCDEVQCTDPFYLIEGSHFIFE